MLKPYRFARPCPNCGQEDELDACKGARTWSSEWGHMEACCSDACGIAYGTSAKRRNAEIQATQQQIKELNNHLRQLKARAGEGA